MRRVYSFLIFSILLSFLLGCGTKGVEKKIEEAERILNEAIEIGAELRAPVAVNVAREKIEYAKELLEIGKTDSALTVSALAVESAREALQTTKEFNSIPDAGR
ncbi:MAG: hypothetical protein N2450_03130 [bacterium]|nr:hypothetical protein [bacterium]